MKKKSNRRWIWIVVVAVVVIGAGVYFALPRLQAQAQAGTPGSYQTSPVTRGDITGTVGATGNIRTNQTVVLNWGTSGIVDKIDVTNGQQVKVGDVLGELNPGSLPQAYLDAQNNLAADQKALDDLLNSGVARANAQVTLIQDEQALQTAQKTAQSKQFQRASQQTIDIAQANLIQAQNALDDAATIYNRNKDRNTNDTQYAAALSQFAAAQQKYDQAQLNLDYVSGLPDPLEVQLANANVQLAQANLLDAQRAWDRVKNGPNPQDVAAAQAKVAADQAILNTSKVTAPIAGTVTVVSSKPGDLVNAQTEAFQIDDLSHLYVDIQVSEVDIDKVKMGMPVVLNFDAIANTNYQGKVTAISTVGTISSGVVNYDVTVELLNRDPAIMNGMTASATITVPGATNAILVPTRAIKTISGRQVVYIEQNGNLVMIPITTGAASTTETEVTNSRLQVGQLVVLNPPATTTTNAGIGGIFGRMFGGGGVRVETGGGFGGGGARNFNGGGTGGNSTGGQRPAGGG